MKEAGHTPGISAYDTVADTAEAVYKYQGAKVSREAIVEGIKAQGFDPNTRAGFAIYAGEIGEQGPESFARITSSPLVGAMQEGYESTLGSHGAQVSRANATKHVPLVDEYDTGAKSAEVIKPKAPRTERYPNRKPKPGDFLIDAEGRTIVVPQEPLSPRIISDDLLKKAAGSAAGSVSASGSPASMTASVASTVSSGGAARVPAAVASTSPPAASAAARTAASVTAPTAARSTRSLVGNALEVGQKLTRGHLGATALGVAAAGLLFGYANRDED